MPKVDRHIPDRRSAKAVIRQCMKNIASNAAIAANVVEKFYPESKILANDLRHFVDINVSMQSIVERYPE